MKGNRKPDFLRQDDPPPMGDVMHIDRVPVGAYFTGVVISPRYAGWPTHWYNKRTIPCIGPAKGCRCASTILSHRWVGMIQWIMGERSSQTILELTPRAGNRLKEILEKRGTLRGLRLQVQRERATLRSPITLTIIGEHESPEQLPSEKDYTPTVQRLWGNAFQA